jgi:formylglycine-generating enzyme required for sulfatase activity
MENQSQAINSSTSSYSQVYNTATMATINAMVGENQAQKDAISRFQNSYNNNKTKLDENTRGSLTQNVKNIRLIEELSSLYVKNFEKSAPIEKLTTIYNINKEFKKLNVGIDNLLSGAQALDQQQYSTAKGLLDASCEEGNAMACDLVQIADLKLAKEAEVAAVIRSIYEEMVLVEGGSFQMGGETTRKAEDDPSQPIHDVRLRDFYLGTYEVTFEQYLAVVNPDRVGQAVRNKRIAVSGISQDVAMGFIIKLNDLTGLNYRLPTEAEWEFAARGGRQGAAMENVDDDKGILGGALSNVSLFKRNNRDKVATIGQEEPNLLGIYDMTGNLFEWCQDYYDPDYYDVAPLDNPQGPTSGRENVLRGGSYDSKNKDRSVDVRNSAVPALASPDFGIRLVLDRK